MSHREAGFVSHPAFAKAAVERAFPPEEDSTPGTPPVVALSYGAWQRRFGGDPAIVGRAIKLNELDYAVAGVAAEGFKGTDAIASGPDCWGPMMMRDQVLIKVFRDAFNARRAMIFNVIGRLNPGVTEQQAETAMRAIGRRLEQDYRRPQLGFGFPGTEQNETRHPFISQRNFIADSI